MPKSKIKLENYTLTMRWKGFWRWAKNITLELDGKALLGPTTREELRTPRNVRLPDGSEIKVWWDGWVRIEEKGEAVGVPTNLLGFLFGIILFCLWSIWYSKSVGLSSIYMVNIVGFLIIITTPLYLKILLNWGREWLVSGLCMVAVCVLTIHSMIMFPLLKTQHLGLILGSSIFISIIILFLEPLQISKTGLNAFDRVQDFTMNLSPYGPQRLRFQLKNSMKVLLDGQQIMFFANHAQQRTGKDVVLEDGRVLRVKNAGVLRAWINETELPAGLLNTRKSVNWTAFLTLFAGLLLSVVSLRLSTAFPLEPLSVAGIGLFLLSLPLILRLYPLYRIVLPAVAVFAMVNFIYGYIVTPGFGWIVSLFYIGLFFPMLLNVGRTLKQLSDEIKRFKGANWESYLVG